MCKQRLLFSGRHIFNADQKRQEQRKKQSVHVKTEGLCDCPSETLRQEEKGYNSITSLFILFRKQRKRGLKFCGYLPISRTLQTSSMPVALLQRTCLIRLPFFIPKLLLSQGSLLRTLEHLCQQLPATSQTAWQHLGTFQIHQTPWGFCHLLQQGLEIILKFLSPRCFCKRLLPSWACPKRQIFVTRDKHILVPNAGPSSQIYNMDKQEIWGCGCYCPERCCSSFGSSDILLL